MLECVLLCLQSKDPRLCVKKTSRDRSSMKMLVKVKL